MIDLSGHILTTKIAYKNGSGSASWVGYVATDKQAFKRFVQDEVSGRVRDAEFGEPFEEELRALATTGMGTEFLGRLLRATPRPENWEVGEAFAECVLAGGGGGTVCFPWNSVGDRKTPRASLPGADLVGFWLQDDDVLLLFGEVKTSSDRGTPPQVMCGGSGMTWQLEENATRLDVQHTLLKWLRRRCQSAEHVKYYRNAVATYLRTVGKEILLLGVLLRDTTAQEADIAGRAKYLSARLPAPTRIEIVGWYLPEPIEKWSAMVAGGPQ